MPTRIDHYCIALLDNLQTDVDEVRLGDNLRIVRLDLLSDPRTAVLLGEDALKVATEIQTEGPLGNGRFHIVRCRHGPMGPIVERIAELSNHALEWRFEGEIEDPFNDHYDRDAPPKLFSDVVTSLRLLKPGLVGRFGAQHIIRGDPSGIEGPWSKGETLNYEPSPMNLFQCYRLFGEDTDDLKETFQAVSRCENEVIRIALRRLDLQYAGRHETDKLIDLMVGFEALYLKGIDAEIGFRLAARVSRHLGEDANARKAVFDCLRTAHGLRSQVVHGSIDALGGSKLLKKGGWASPEAFVEQLSSYLREALRSILLDIGTQRFGSDFHIELDDALIRGDEFSLGSSKGT